MAEEKKITAREKFLQAYANVPLQVRSEIIVVLEDKPISWDVAYLEVRNNTEKGSEILRKLAELKIF